MPISQALAEDLSIVTSDTWLPTINTCASYGTEEPHAQRPDEEIDYSDISPLTESFWKNAVSDQAEPDLSAMFGLDMAQDADPAPPTRRKPAKPKAKSLPKKKAAPTRRKRAG